MAFAVGVWAAGWASGWEADSNWPGWRGGNGSGQVRDADYPVEWNDSSNVLWKVPIGGSGNSSPIVWGDRVFLTAAENQGRKRSVFCFDRSTGSLRWRTQVPSDSTERTHEKNGHASSTPVTDGELVWAFFGSAGVIAVDFDGRIAWHRDLGEFKTVWGVASSPVLFESLLIVNCDQDGENEVGPTQSFLIALDKGSGEPVWRVDRSDQPRSWSTPVIVQTESGPELVLNGGRTVVAYDPRTGERLWSCSGTTDWVTPTVVSGGGLVYAVSGSNGPTLAIRPGGRGDVTATHLVWRAKRGGPYIPSPVLYDGRLYMVNDGGIMTCYDSTTGRVIFQHRLPASTFSASPVVAHGKLYITSETGETFVFAAGTKVQIVSRNPLGEPCLASPAFSRGQIFIRTERHLWCIGQ